MESVRPRFLFGKCVDDVKLRKRRSKFYTRQDENRLNNGMPIFCVLAVAFRVLNCFLVRSSFVPDEYWQSLEVSHHMAFNYGYLTWEWKEGIRGYTYPLFFALLYKLLQYINCDTVYLLIWLPRVVLALLAAIADVRLYLFVKMLENSDVAKWALFCQLCSWFTFYCCTRTLTNSIETTLTTVALSYFPLRHSKACSSKKYLALLALAVTVRPTALIVWFPLLVYHFWKENNKQQLITHNYIPIGGLTIVISTTIDCIFYGKWTFVQMNFLKFNVFSGVAGFYGSHPWHWYFTQGIVVLIGPHLPLCLHGYILLSKRYRILWITVLWTIVIYSFLPHKEFRFIYPVLPLCMILSGISLAQIKTWRRVVVSSLLVANLLPALYMGLVHQRGALDVMNHLQALCETTSITSDPHLQPDILFLMPCHSTPFYCHMHCPVRMRFLECAPDLGQEGYTDEAEIFFNDPLQWLKVFCQERFALPTHLVLFDVLEKEIDVFLHGNNYVKTAEIFHSHFPERRVGGKIFIYARY